MRRIFIGDVQGCLEPLDELIRKLQLHADDRVYCVGDLVNRGPDSPGVVRRLRDLQARVVLGNHDLHLLAIVAGTAGRVAGDRLDGMLHAPDRDALLGWLSAQPVLRVEEDIMVVHAGLQPAWTDLEAIAARVNAAAGAHVHGHREADVTFATAVRYCDAHGRRPRHDHPPPGAPFEPWDHFYRGVRTVVFGHWARRGLVVRPNVRGLDTGCVYGGPLTAWIAEEDRLVQVPGLGGP